MSSHLSLLAVEFAPARRHMLQQTIGSPPSQARFSGQKPLRIPYNCIRNLNRRSPIFEVVGAQPTSCHGSVALATAATMSGVT